MPNPTNPVMPSHAFIRVVSCIYNTYSTVFIRLSLTNSVLGPCSDVTYSQISNLLPHRHHHPPADLTAPVHEFFLFLFKFLFVYLFIFGCIGSSLLHTVFLQLRPLRAILRCGVWASHCGGFSCCGAQALSTQASIIVAHRLSGCGLRALECRLSSCRARAQLLRSMGDLPGPGLEPVSPVLAGRFLTTVSPGKSPPWCVITASLTHFPHSVKDIFNLFYSPTKQ